MKVLLVEENASDARLVRKMLEESGTPGVNLVHVPRLTVALKRIRHESFDAILFDPGPPDARGLEAMRRVQESMNDFPVVLFGGHRAEEEPAGVEGGDAADLVVENRGDGALLMQAIRRAIERKASERQIQHLAYHDGLTALPNRRLLMDRLIQALARAHRDHKVLALLFVDLDDFKGINDTLGHAAGDELLQSVAARISKRMRESDTLARFGGDEFAILLPELSRIEDAGKFASKLQQALAAPFDVGGRQPDPDGVLPPARSTDAP